VDVRWSDDVARGDWVRERLGPFASGVGGVVPHGFAAYARVLHPVEDGSARGRRWAEVAAANGRILHPEAQLHAIATPAGRPARNAHEELASTGSLPAPQLAALVEVLAHHTPARTRCWCAVWDGFGQLHGAVATLTWHPGSGATSGRPDPLVPADVLAGPRLRVPQRDMLLAEAALDEVPALAAAWGDQSPSLWWPDDRAWCVATEIDLASTYVGGSEALVEAVRAEPRLEVLLSDPAHRVAFDSDDLNRALDGPG
jgi:hypothetical protein